MISCTTANRTSELCAAIKFIAVLIILITPCSAMAEPGMSIVLTSNLEGRFSTAAESQDEKDPMLLLAQSIIAEKNRKHFDLYLDMGNSFYPGPLSRYSYGSVMMDYFTHLNCSATLVSSRDVSIGLTNLEFLSGGRSTKLLSANITRENKPVFTPYIIVNHEKRRIGFIGVTSSDSLFDIADKKVLNIYFNEYLETIKNTAAALKSEGCTDIIVLSGLSYRNNMELMHDIPEISLVISGGDSSGKIFSVPSSRVDLQWGRSILSLTRNDGFYRIELDFDDSITVKSMSFTPSAYKATSDQSYAEFKKRLTLWKERFAAEENHLLTEKLPPASVTDETAAELLRHRHRTEIAIVEKYSIVPQAIYGTVYLSTINSMINNNYPVLTYKLSGADLQKISDQGEDLLITGLKDGKVQGYTISDSRMYTVSSTQSAYDRACRILRKNISYDNTWKTLRDEFEDDIKSEHVISSENFDYLEDRFRILVDLTLSNFYDWSQVNRGDNIDTPPGKPEETYKQWGMEDTLNITIYNRNHNILITPYIYLIKQDEVYLQNLLRGTLLYTYRMSNYVRPYHKSRLDTVVFKVDGRPMLARETIGASLITDRVTGRIGVGFEKQIQDPENPVLYGIETIVDANFPVTDDIKYLFKLDSFISAEQRKYEKLKSRNEMTNALSLKINSLLGVSLKYKWFKLYSKEIEESYDYSQLLLSIDLNTDFKFF